MSFNFNISHIPQGPVIYPPVADPQAHQIEIVKSSNSDTSLPKKTSSILRKNISKSVANSCKSLTWNKKQRVRLVAKNEQVHEEYITNTSQAIYQFFHEHKAIQKNKPGGDDAATGKWSRRAKDVKEIALFSMIDSLKELDNAELLKNYHRLKGKMQHIFSQRSARFQREVQKYLNRYQQEVESRQLNLSSIHKPLED